MGVEFHVCTINKSAHTKKSGNLFDNPRIYLFLYKLNRYKVKGLENLQSKLIKNNSMNTVERKTEKEKGKNNEKKKEKIRKKRRIILRTKEKRKER